MNSKSKDNNKLSGYANRLLRAYSLVHNLDGSTGSAGREYGCIKGMGKADSRNRVARECTEYCMWHSRPSFAEEKSGIFRWQHCNQTFS